MVSPSVFSSAASMPSPLVPLISPIAQMVPATSAPWNHHSAPCTTTATLRTRSYHVGTEVGIPAAVHRPGLHAPVHRSGGAGQRRAEGPDRLYRLRRDRGFAACRLVAADHDAAPAAEVRRQ